MPLGSGFPVRVPIWRHSCPSRACLASAQGFIHEVLPWSRVHLLRESTTGTSESPFQQPEDTLQALCCAQAEWGQLSSGGC